MNQITDNSLLPNQCNRYLEFALTPIMHNNLVFIKSPMGSGKTHSISKYFETHKYVLYISTRITFTQSVGSKYQLKSYLEAKTEMTSLEFTEENPKWIVQIDSLHLFKNLECADLIIVDEVESLFDQITFCKQSTKVYDSFL